ncbi:MAG: hypothetical protein WKF70_09345 [Chitinophagaceae bacterium]
MKNILMVFTDPHLPYSPTIINLFNELKKHSKVQIITYQPEQLFSLQKLDDPDILYLSNADLHYRPEGLLKRTVKKAIEKIIKPSPAEIVRRNLHTNKTEAVIKKIRDFEGEIIAVDFLALYCVQQAGKAAHLVSLEIHLNDRYRDNCLFDKIKSVIIQSNERYAYLFKDLQIPTFIVQNSPRYSNIEPDKSARRKNKLIYCGSAVPGFGIFSCLDFLLDYPEYQLTVKGAVPPSTKEAIEQFYKQLIVEERLILDDSYMSEESLNLFVSRFRIGFVFYDLYRFDHVRTFNYYTAPSGKMFQYFNSGVPVIGNRLPGLEIIEHSKSGVLISYLSSAKMKQAIDQIESSYDEYADNSKKTSKDFDFTTNIQDFITFIKN